MITNTRTNFKALPYYTVEYSYWGFDGERHTAESVIRGKGELDALKTLECIIFRYCTIFRKTKQKLIDGEISVRDTFAVLAVKAH